MIYFSKDAEDNLNKLLYYPYTIGSHIDKVSIDVRNIMNEFFSLPIGRVGRTMRITIPHVGIITYMFTPTLDVVIKSIRWDVALRRFYYTKSNFITFTTSGNIPSVHPSLYTVRYEDFFKCDNGYMVVSRKYRGKDLFNFIDTSDGFARLVSEIDFTQVLPFSEDKDMTARGYTPDRRCWMVFEDGDREEVNETKKYKKSNTIRLTETKLRQIITESIRNCLKEL